MTTTQAPPTGGSTIMAQQLDDIVGWLEQQPGATEYLQWINQGTPAYEALAAYEFDTGRKMDVSDTTPTCNRYGDGPCGEDDCILCNPAKPDEAYEVEDLLEQAQDMLEQAIALVQQASEVSRTHGFGVDKQLDAYTVPWLQRFAGEDRNQPGAIGTMLQEFGQEER